MSHKTTKDLAEYYEVENIYDYIGQSVLNGQFKQAHTLCKEVRQTEDHTMAEFSEVIGTNYGQGILSKAKAISFNLPPFDFDEVIDWRK
jgi:hypothetical protein